MVEQKTTRNTIHFGSVFLGNDLTLTNNVHHDHEGRQFLETFNIGLLGWKGPEKGKGSEEGCIKLVKVLNRWGLKFVLERVEALF